MQAFSLAFQQPMTVYGLAGAIVLWAVLSGLPASLAVRRVKRDIAIAVGRLRQFEGAAAFTRDYETVSTELLDTGVVAGCWRRLRETLLADPEAKRLVRATVPPVEFFESMSLLRDARLDPRYHSALPGLLVGVGLLCTFLGLTLALQSASGVVAAGVDQTQRNHALQQLLDLASFKFITSLTGLFCSIAYTLFWKRYCLRPIDAAIDTLVDLLERLLPIRTQLAAQEEANVLAERQLTALEAFSTEFTVRIGDKVDSAFDQRLGEHIGPLREVLERLAARDADHNQAAMQQMLDAFLNKLQGGAGDRMQEVATRLADLGEGLKALESGLRDAATRMADAADAMARRMGEGAEAALSRITDQMGGLAEMLRAIAEQTRSAGADAGRDMAARIEQAASGFEAAARGVAETLAQAAEALHRRMGAEAEAGAARLGTQVEAMVAELRALAEANRNAGNEALTQLAERIAAAASGFEVTAARVADALTRASSETGSALGRGAEEAVTRIAAATEGMRSELQAMLAELCAALGGAGEAFRRSGAEGAAALSGTRRRGTGFGAGSGRCIDGAAGGWRCGGRGCPPRGRRSGRAARPRRRRVQRPSSRARARCGRSGPHERGAD